MDTMHTGTYPKPRQATAESSQPPKNDPLKGVAVNVTNVPETKLAEQATPSDASVPHAMAPGLPTWVELTAPRPVPSPLTERLNVGSGTKLAVSVIFDRGIVEISGFAVEFKVPPVQLTNKNPASGVAVSVTELSAVKLLLQTAPGAGLPPQLIVPGEDCTRPPAGVGLMVNVAAWAIDRPNRAARAKAHLAVPMRERNDGKWPDVVFSMITLIVTQNTRL
jgi:hypothetical protein